MRTRKQELVSDDLKPFVCGIIKEYREKYNYSLEDLARALNYKKNRQTLHKYETGTLNIPYEIFFDIAEIFNISSDVIKDIPMTREEEELVEFIAEKADLTKADAGRALEAMIEGITEGLKKEGKVTFVGFGTFTAKKRAAREGRNPQTGETVKIAARVVPGFKAGSKLKDALN